MKILKKLICVSLIMCMCISGTVVTTLAETVSDENDIEDAVVITESTESEQDVDEEATIQDTKNTEIVLLGSPKMSNVDAVILALENIDSLQEMQDARSKYSDSSSYETYKTNMFKARENAKVLYDALTQEEQALIPSELVSKLNDELDDYWIVDNNPGFSKTIKQGKNEYTWQLLSSPSYYERSNHVNKNGTSSVIRLLVDSSANNENTWTWKPSPLNDLWNSDTSNYELVYCTDMITSAIGDTYYKRTNLEASDYYTDEDAKHIRTILTNSYPFISMDEMKTRLINGGMDENLVNNLTRSDVIAAVQYSIWTYSNKASGNDVSYGKTKTVKNSDVYHGCSNEIWYWYDTTNGSYVPEVDDRISKLVKYLTSLESTEAAPEQIVIDSIIIEKAKAIEDLGKTFNVSLKIKLNGIANDKSDIKLTAKTSIDEVSMTLDDSNDYSLTIKANKGEKINIKVEGTQYLPNGVYFYDPEGGRASSQSLVGIAKGSTRILVEDSTKFDEKIEVPEEPIDPEDPEKPTVDPKDNENQIGIGNIVKTGDTFNIVWVIVLLISSFLLLVIISNKKLFNK